MIQEGIGIGVIQEGLRVSYRYKISREVYQQFLAAFGDTNPLHLDDAYAQQCGLPEKVMHGMILGGFISHFVGVRFPGAGSLLHAVNTQFKSPCHLGDEILIEATVTQVVESVKVVAMDMVLRNVTRNRVAAKSKVQVGIL
jgi:3-hydroxybutyryl-CoA dehydratase